MGVVVRRVQSGHRLGERRTDYIRGRLSGELATVAFKCHAPLMSEGLEKIVQIACEEFRKLLSEDKATGIEIEEVEEQPKSGHYFVILGYWAKDNKPRPTAISPAKSREFAAGVDNLEDFLNPWRKKFKRVEVDPARGKAIAIRMYEPPLGVS